MVRAPAVAGTFYPEDPQQLQQQVQNHLAQGVPTTHRPKALIAPHAGYIYSGPIAGSAYRTLAPIAEQIEKVILLGPAHRVAFQGVAAPHSTHFRTPLGEVPIDQPLLQQVLSLPAIIQHDEPHRMEHSLEVQLPFLQQLLPHFTLLPLVVGQSTPETIATLLDHCWGGRETLIVISSDLSHYLPYEQAQQLDQQSSTAITTFHGEALVPESACGRLPIQGLLQLTRRKRLTATTLDLRNSGDTAGDHARVVGYGAYLFYSGDTDEP